MNFIEISEIAGCIGAKIMRVCSLPGVLPLAEMRMISLLIRNV